MNTNREPHCKLWLLPPCSRWGSGNFVFSLNTLIFTFDQTSFQKQVFTKKECENSFWSCCQWKYMNKGIVTFQVVYRDIVLTNMAALFYRSTLNRIQNTLYLTSWAFSHIYVFGTGLVTLTQHSRWLRRALRYIWKIKYSIWNLE